MNTYVARLKATLVTPVLAMTVLVIAGFWLSWAELGMRWINPDNPFSHGWLIAGISLFQICAVAINLDYSQSRPAYWMLLPLAALGGLCHILNLISIQSGQMALLPLILVCCYWLVLGWNQAKQFVFPAFLLYFAIPIWTPVLLALQSITVHVNGFLLNLGNISFTIDGDLITIPVGTFEVEGGCSGLKYFLTSCSLAALYSYWYIPKWRSRLLLGGVAISLAMLTNWIRVFVIVLVGYYTDMKSPLIKDHNNFGWLLYAASLVPFYFVANRLTPAPEKKLPRVRLAAGINGRNFIPVIAATVLMTLMFAGNQGIKTGSHPLYPTWKLTDLPPDNGATPGWTPQVFDAATRSNQRFIAPGFSAPLMLTQFQFAEPWYYEIKDYRDDYFPAPWQMLSQSLIDLPGVGKVNSVEVGRAGTRQKWVVLYWYTVSHQTTTSPLKAKILQAGELLSLRYGAALTFLSTACDSNCAGVRKRLIAQSDRLKHIDQN